MSRSPGQPHVTMATHLGGRTDRHWLWTRVCKASPFKESHPVIAVLPLQWLTIHFNVQTQQPVLWPFTRRSVNRWLNLKRVRAQFSSVTIPSKRIFRPLSASADNFSLQEQGDKITLDMFFGTWKRGCTHLSWCLDQTGQKTCCLTGSTQWQRRPVMQRNRVQWCVSSQQRTSLIAVFFLRLSEHDSCMVTAAACAMVSTWFITGYEGIRYPWESAYSGHEVSPSAECGNYEQHITGYSCDLSLVNEMHKAPCKVAGFSLSVCCRRHCFCCQTVRVCNSRHEMAEWPSEFQSKIWFWSVGGNCKILDFQAFFGRQRKVQHQWWEYCRFMHETG